MRLETKRTIIALLAGAFIVSLLFVQWMEVVRKAEEAGLRTAHVAVPAASQDCVSCHEQANAGIVDHWKDSTHAQVGVACVECHEADKAEADAFEHYGETIATIVTPKDCARCHTDIAREFEESHHASAGNILASLDNFLAETVEGSRVPFQPHSPTPGMEVDEVWGLASANSGCQQCHGAKVAIEGTDARTGITLAGERETLSRPRRDGLVQPDTEALDVPDLVVPAEAFLGWLDDAVPTEDLAKALPAWASRNVVTALGSVKRTLGQAIPAPPPLRAP